MSGSDKLTKALKEARLAEAAQLDAVLSLHDAKSLRLDALQALVLPRIADHAEAKSLFELNIQQGPNPRLWIDLISSVVMEPDPQTYRLLKDKNGSREIVYETRNLDDMADFVIKYLAHRILAHDQSAADVKTFVQSGKNGYSIWEMIYVWATGCAFGVLSLLVVAMLLGKLHF